MLEFNVRKEENIQKNISKKQTHENINGFIIKIPDMDDLHNLNLKTFKNQDYLNLTD